MSESLEIALGYHFRRPELLQEALTHRSALSRAQCGRCNERLEFLGDSILSAIVAHHLYREHPNEAEGELSKRKALLVSRPSLARWAMDLKLGSHLVLGAGEESSGGRFRPSMLADALEAVIGAIYLDGGYEAARRLIDGWMVKGEVDFEETDYKSRLQEMMHKRYRMPPQYVTLSTAGPEHDKTFSVEVRMGKEILGTGAGKSKKEAEQAAAKNAMKNSQSLGPKEK